MDYKRALFMAVLSYLVGFAVGNALASILRIPVWEGAEITTIFWLVSIFFTIILMAVFTLWYFKDTTIKPNVREGLLLGAVFVVVGFILDVLFIVPYMIKKEVPLDILQYFTDVFFWLTIVSIFVTTGALGWYLGRK